VAKLDALNGDPETARQNLKQCCGSQRWVIEMMLERPFRDLEHVYQAASKIWQRLGHQDWLEAFSHHPRIGQVVAKGAASDRERSWAEQEQAGTAQADASVRSALAQGNREYEAKFGFLYLVCATGKSGAEMLELQRLRLRNSPEIELAIAAGEQEMITRIRLEKLLSS